MRAKLRTVWVLSEGRGAGARWARSGRHPHPGHHLGPDTRNDPDASWTVIYGKGGEPRATGRSGVRLHVDVCLFVGWAAASAQRVGWAARHGDACLGGARSVRVIRRRNCDTSPLLRRLVHSCIRSSICMCAVARWVAVGSSLPVHSLLSPLFSAVRSGQYRPIWELSINTATAWVGWAVNVVIAMHIVYAEQHL